MSITVLTLEKFTSYHSAVVKLGHLNSVCVLTYDAYYHLVMWKHSYRSGKFYPLDTSSYWLAKDILLLFERSFKGTCIESYVIVESDIFICVVSITITTYVAQETGY